MTDTGADRCPNCGRRIMEHPTLEGLREGSTIWVCPSEERAAKWKRVEPGTVIPAGQPWAVHFLPRVGTHVTWSEYVAEDFPQTVPAHHYQEWFVDSSWNPPPALPTEPCVIRAKVKGPVPYRVLFGHPNPGEEGGMTFCRDVDGLTYKADEIESFEVLWTEKA